MKETKDKGNQSRFKRDRESYANLTLTDRDRAIIKLVYEHRFLDTQLISDYWLFILTVPKRSHWEGRQRKTPVVRLRRTGIGASACRLFV